MLVDPAIAKQHQRISGADEDTLVQLYLDAAERAALTYLNRKVYEKAEDLDAAVDEGTAGRYPMVVTADIQTAMYLIFGHLYANRESVMLGVPATRLPDGPWALLEPYRVSPGI